MALLRLHNVSKSFSRTQALTEISFELLDQTSLVLVGANGAGKSTLLRLIAGLEQPDQGEVLINGINVAKLPPHQRGVALVTQDYAAYPHLSVRKNLEAAQSNLKSATADRRRTLDETCDLLELGNLMDRRPAELSGGQLQRAALAKAVVRQPTLLLLDEPFSQLDALVRHQLQPLLMRLSESLKIAVIASMHDPLSFLPWASYIAVLDAGKLVQFDPSGVVNEEPKTKRVAELLSVFGLNEVVLNGQLGLHGKFFFRPDAVIVEHASSSAKELTEERLQFQIKVDSIENLGFAHILIADWSQQKLRIFVPNRLHVDQMTFSIEKRKLWQFGS